MTERRETTSDTVVRNVKALRLSRGWSAARLAEQCAADGYPSLTVSVLSNIESGRRDASGRRRREVSVDELVALARALEVTPATLLGTGPVVMGTPHDQVRVSGTATGHRGGRFFEPPRPGAAHAVELTDSVTATVSLAVESEEALPITAVVVPSEIRMDYGDMTVVYAYAETAKSQGEAMDATVETSEEGDEDGR